MLIGVGGSGKQSLSRLSAFICGFEVRQLSVTSKFKVNDDSFVKRHCHRNIGLRELEQEGDMKTTKIRTHAPFVCCSAGEPITTEGHF